MTLPIVAGVVLFGGLIAVFAMRGGDDDDAPDAPDAAGEETSRPRDGGAGARSSDGGGPAAADARGTRPGAPPTEGELTIGEGDAGATGAEIPADRQPGQLPPDPKFGPAVTQMASWTTEEGYGEAPSPTLQARFDRVIAGMATGRQVSLASIGCKAGGADCRLVGTSPTPDDIRTFAEGIEQSPPEGDEQLPTVAIEETHSASSGETRFKIGVYYP